MDEHPIYSAEWNQALDEKIRVLAARTEFGPLLAAKGIATVSLGPDGTLEYHPAAGQPQAS